MELNTLIHGERLAVFGAPTEDREVISLTRSSIDAGHGSVFFCIRGRRYDGHAFAGDAYDRGCRIFVAEEELHLPPDATVLLVLDVRRTMARMARRFYDDPARGLTVIGITGTKGKTTTAKMIVGLLSSLGIPAAYIGSSGAAWQGFFSPTENTTPDSLELHALLRKIRDAGNRIVVMEVSSQALAQDRVFGIPFSLGVFTNLSRDHIGDGEHRSMREYRAAKLSFFRNLAPSLAILFGEDRFSRRIARVMPRGSCLYYGRCRDSRLWAKDLSGSRTRNAFYTNLTLVFGKREAKARLAFAGKHYVDNLLAALLATETVTGCRIEELLPYIEGLSADGRCEVIPTERAATFVIDYAHNGASIAAALRGLRPFTEGKLYCVFGAVGGRSECRRRDMARAASRYADYAIITEDDPGLEDPAHIAAEILLAFPTPAKARVILDRREAIEYLVARTTNRDVVLLAGKGDDAFQITKNGKIPFSESEILAPFRLPPTI